jgi:Tfp pilus assembly PilM family ATPase
MRNLFGRSARGPIGLDLYGREIKAVQLIRDGKGWRVESAVALPRAEAALDAAQAARIADVFARQGFKGRRVVLAAPVNKLECEMLELPPRGSGAPVEAIARTEMASVAKLSQGAFEMASWDLPAPPRGGGGTSMLAVALRHEDAQAVLDPLLAVGLDVVAIDTRAGALARALSPLNLPETLAVLDLDWDGGYVLFVHNGDVLFQRNLADVGLGTLYRAVETKFDLTEQLTDYVLSHPAQDPSESQWQRIRAEVAQYAAMLSDELESSLAFAAHRYRDLAPKRLLMCGAGAPVNGLCEQLSSRLKITVEPAPVASLATCPAHLASVCAAPAMMTALGLAMYG